MTEEDAELEYLMGPDDIEYQNPGFVGWLERSCCSFCKKPMHIVKDDLSQTMHVSGKSIINLALFPIQLLLGIFSVYLAVLIGFTYWGLSLYCALAIVVIGITITTHYRDWSDYWYEHYN